MDALWNLLPLILEAAIPVIVILLGWGVRALAKKLGVEEQLNVDALVDSIVGRAVLGLEQLSELAQKQGKAALTSEEKLATAVRLISDEMKILKLPELTGELLRIKVEAYLQALKINKE